MVKKGDLVKFKAGLFGIEIPQNYGIFMRSYKNKRSKSHVVELYTLKGKQETKHENVQKKNLGESVQLKGNQLPESKIMGKELKQMINRLTSKLEQLQRVDTDVGELNERALWIKLTGAKLYEGKKAYTIEELAFVWYGIKIEDISRNRLKKMRDKLGESHSFGKGYFDRVPGHPEKWLAITPEQYKSISKEISILGSLRNKMFHMIEIPVEESEDPDETEMVRAPKEWDDVKFDDEELTLFPKLQELMEFHVINDTWIATGLGGTDTFAIDGFSLRGFLSRLAEDWINEGKTSYSDAFLKMLIRTGFWHDTDALMAISQRVIKLADHFDWETDTRIDEIALKFQEPSETPEIFDNRLDLRELESFTIDPPTAKDFDDAVSLEETDDGYRLWVHIADVAHYVAKDTSLDVHAKGRATSVYLPTKTLPMLPNHLSDNLCSLREQVPRLAMSVEIHYDDDGIKQLDQCRVHNSVIQVTRNLSYDYVNQAIEDEERPFSDLLGFAELLQEHRKGLKLETDDVRLELGGQMAITTKTSSNSTKMIETFMVAANETVAELLEKYQKPVVFRNHPLPDKFAVDRYNAHVKVLGIEHEIELPKLEDENNADNPSLIDMLADKGAMGGNITFSIGGGGTLADELKASLEEASEEKDDEVDMGQALTKGLAQLTEEQQILVLKPFQEAIRKVEEITDDYEQRLGYLTVLKTLSRALYAAGNFGHFGLGSTAYVHFTSPIRRYPDIIAHRVCKAMIAGEELVYSPEEIDEIAVHCTEQSTISERLERTVVGAGFSFLSRNPDYTMNREGIVASISGGGVFVLLPNGIEARIPLSKITTRKTYVDQHESMCFVGFRSTDHISEEVTADNWRDYLQDNTDDEPVEILLKIGDKVRIEFVGWNHLDGRVTAALVASTESD